MTHSILHPNSAIGRVHFGSMWPKKIGDPSPFSSQSRDTGSHWKGQDARVSHPLPLQVAEAKFLVKASESSDVPVLHLAPTHRVENLSQAQQVPNTKASIAFAPAHTWEEVSVGKGRIYNPYPVPGAVAQRFCPGREAVPMGELQVILKGSNFIWNRIWRSSNSSILWDYGDPAGKRLRGGW